jgi:hypothetical protein
MADINPELVAAKQRAEEELLKIPGVTGVDVGYKEVNGKPTGVVAIRVLVAEKKPPTKVSKAERIPEEIDGHPTDVIERRFELHPARVALEELVLEADTGTYTPLKGGISLGPCRSVGGFVYVGTLGAIVRDNVTGNAMMLSNFHVMCIDNGFHVGDTQAQPGLVDGGSCPADVVGTLARESLGGSVDCAVADITASRGTACEIVDIGAIAGTNTVALSDAVRKRGRTTGLTYGTVDSISLSVNIDYGAGIGTRTLTNQIGVKPDTAHNAKFGDHGDSGSVVVNNAREVVGLHFAGDPTGYGIANPIAAVLNALNVRMCTPVKLKDKDKDFKDHKFEKVEHKDAKFEKIEHKEQKEFKLEKDEHKDVKFEKIEHKEHKDQKEFKLEKNEHKDVKFEKIEQKELSKLEHGEKGIGPKEKDGKELKEGAGEGPGPGPGPGPIETRLSALEQAVSQLTHFISAAQRPDLSYGALSGEADLVARSEELAGQAAAAKSVKDDKDLEKLADR